MIEPNATRRGVHLGKSKREVTSLKQRRIPGIVNLFEVSDPSQIKALANDPIVDRFFDTRTCLSFPKIISWRSDDAVPTERA